jgi:hypothetical protein
MTATLTAAAPYLEQTDERDSLIAELSWQLAQMKGQLEIAQQKIVSMGRYAGFQKQRIAELEG